MVVPAGNKAKRFSLVNHSTKIIHHDSSASFFRVSDNVNSGLIDVEYYR